MWFPFVATPPRSPICRISPWRLVVTIALVAATLAIGVAPTAARSDPPASSRIIIDQPGATEPLIGEVVVSGWAADVNAGTGVGVRAIHVYLDNPPEAGGVFLGVAEYGLPRADVAAAFGKTNLAASGFHFRWSVAAPPGDHRLVVVAVFDELTWFSAAQAIRVDPRAPRYPTLLPPDEDESMPNRVTARAELQRFGDAMAELRSMRERRFGQLRGPAGNVINEYSYEIEFLAPDRFRQRSRVTTLVDSREQQLITIGKKAWFWRGGDNWEETFNREEFAWPGAIYRLRGITGAARQADDLIAGRVYRVVEYSQAGSVWIGAPGWFYRVRLWIDAETGLPLKLEKAASVNQVLETTQVNTYQYHEDTEFYDFNASISIAPPG